MGIFGFERPTSLPPWELVLENLAPGAAAIATAKVKHNPRYQEERGIFRREAELPVALRESIAPTPRRSYRVLALDGYARIDYRLRDDGAFYFLEANPNPDIAESQEFASAAEAHGGSTTPLDRLVRQGRAASRPAR